MKKLFLLILLFWIIISWGILNEKQKAYVFPTLYNFPEMPVNESNFVTEEGVELGRHLFYDSILSKDYSISCGTCHQQKNAFASDKRFDIGINDDTLFRNTPPLFNLAWYNELFWDGRAVNIERQIFEPVRSHKEMGTDWLVVEERIRQSDKYQKMFQKAFGSKKIDSILIAKAIAQFERTILSYRSKYDQVLKGENQFTDDEYDGFVIVNDQSMGNCFQCHNTDAHALGTNGGYSNNGLDPYTNVDEYNDLGRGDITGKVEDIGKFKVPTLRNVALTAPYMHDGRFSTLEEVLDFYSNHVSNSINVDSKLLAARSNENKLTKEEQLKVIVFLKTLTDSALINDSSFSNPYH